LAIFSWWLQLPSGQEGYLGDGHQLHEGLDIKEVVGKYLTEMIERLNKEFRRRTKVMEIVAGEIACYRILAYISLKMEMHWRSNPVGKVRKNLLFFKELAYEHFTQKT
jgi:putative transposase